MTRQQKFIKENPVIWKVIDTVGDFIIFALKVRIALQLIQLIWPVA